MLELALRHVGVSERLDSRFHAVARSTNVATRALEALEAFIDTAPARADEVDEECEVVDACMPLGEEVALDPLEATNRLVQEATNLGDVPCDGEDLGTDAVPYGGTHVLRDRHFELGGGDGQRLDLSARTLECGLDRGRLGSSRLLPPQSSASPARARGCPWARGYSQRRMDTSLLEYDLPDELVAQTPIEPRDGSRLLVYRRVSGAIEHRTVAELPDVLGGELVVVNDTRVVPARLNLRRASGGAVEVLLVERVDDNGTWEALVRPSRRLRSGEVVGPVRLREARGDGRWLVEVEGEPDGEMPLPPYIHEPLADPERYQTVYGTTQGSAAAPTAGLHFTQELLATLDPVSVTLHVGLDTFRPVTESRLEEHEVHGERYAVAAHSWKRIAAADRVLAVGTTTVRVLETVARSGELAGRTTLFIAPGFEFRRVDALLTNFHLPRSTLLALVMAFVGVEATREIYRAAIEERYRFYSFGDAMVVL